MGGKPKVEETLFIHFCFPVNGETKDIFTLSSRTSLFSSRIDIFHRYLVEPHWLKWLERDPQKLEGSYRSCWEEMPTMGVETLGESGGRWEGVGHQERLPGRGGSWNGPGVEGFLGKNCGWADGSWWGTSRKSLFQSSGLFSWKRRHLFFFLPFFSSASRLGKVTKANVYYLLCARGYSKSFSLKSFAFKSLNCQNISMK